MTQRALCPACRCAECSHLGAARAYLAAQAKRIEQEEAGLPVTVPLPPDSCMWTDGCPGGHTADTACRDFTLREPGLFDEPRKETP